MRLSQIAFLLVIFSIAILSLNHIWPFDEGFRAGSKCPSSLVRSGDKLMLIYDNAPIYFDDLDDYVEFVNKLRSEGIDCPVSMIEDAVEVSNQIKKEEVLDATRDSKLYNKDLYPGFDPQGQHIGRFTPLDAIHESTGKPKLSDNPMDTNWGGVEHTQDMVASGKYVDREITKQASFTPKVQFFPDLKQDPKLFKGSRQ
jgi:hypothetical protein